MSYIFGRDARKNIINMKDFREEKEKELCH